MPAYCESEVIGGVIERIQKAGFDYIVVVSDGSPDNTAEIAEVAGAHVFRHAINRGAGAATQTAIEASLALGADVIVLIDADGQHDPDDISRLIEPILEDKADVVIGSRFLKKNEIPAHRRLFNTIGNLVTFVLFGAWVSDSQSGFKALSRAAAERVDIRSNGYEFCSELIWTFRAENFRITEVPISVQYTARSLGKGQSLFVGVKTFFRLLLHSLMRVR